MVSNNRNSKYFFNGRYHRTDGPAYEDSDGTKQWWFNGKLHRLDGPAIQYPNGSKKWWVYEIVICNIDDLLFCLTF